MTKFALFCSLVPLCLSAAFGAGTHHSSKTQSLRNEIESQEDFAPRDTQSPRPLSDSLYTAIEQQNSYGMERDTALWKYLARDYINSFPQPSPAKISGIKGDLLVLTSKTGVPMVRRIARGPDTLLVAVHMETKGGRIFISYWKRLESIWQQAGKTHIFESNEEPKGAVEFIGDSGSECVAIGARRHLFGLYRLGVDSMPCILSDTLTIDTARYVGFYQGNHAGRFGSFAAETRKEGTGGWERLFVYYWNGDSCRRIPIPGIGDDAIAKNHISKCRWIEPDTMARPLYAELLISEQYIDSRSLPARVYRFDGNKWMHVSGEHTALIAKTVHDARYRDSHLLLYDTAFAHSWMDRNADTLRAHTGRIRYFGYKMSHMGYIGKLFPIGLYYFSRQKWDSAFATIKILHTPWGENDDRELLSGKQLETIKAYLIGCGDLAHCGFADSLFLGIRRIHDADFGLPIAPLGAVKRGPLPDKRLASFVDSLWPHALEEAERLRLYREKGKEIIMAERKTHHALSLRADALAKRPSLKATARLWNELRAWYTGRNMPFFMFAERDKKIRSRLNVYALAECKKLFGQAARDTAFVPPGDLLHSVLLNYCRPDQRAFFDSLALRYDTCAPYRTARLLTYGLSLGDSSALQHVKSYLSRNETYIDTVVYSLFQPGWALSLRRARSDSKPSGRCGPRLKHWPL
jgi:hypothetical protein